MKTIYVLSCCILFVILIFCIYLAVVHTFYKIDCKLFYNDKLNIDKENEKFINNIRVSKKPVKLKYNILYVGICRDVAKHLPKVLKNINVLRSISNKSKLIVYENDSKDNTLEILQNYKNNNHDTVIISENGIMKNIPKTKRTITLAYCRNKILEYIEKNNLYSKFDYMVVLDLDNVCEKILYSGFYNSFKNVKDWDILGANQVGSYYDYWALRTKKYNTNIHDHSLRMKNLRIKKKYIKPYIELGGYFNLKTKKKFNQKFHKVISCFGGLAIYNIKKIKGCWYDSDDGKDCEHVKFHKSLNEKYNTKIFINGKLLIKGWEKN